MVDVASGNHFLNGRDGNFRREIFHLTGRHRNVRRDRGFVRDRTVMYGGKYHFTGKGRGNCFGGNCFDWLHGATGTITMTKPMPPVRFIMGLPSLLFMSTSRTYNLWNIYTRYCLTSTAHPGLCFSIFLEYIRR